MHLSVFSLLTIILLCATSSGISAAAMANCPDGREGWSDADRTRESRRPLDPDYPPRFMLDFGLGYGWGVREVVPDELRPLVSADEEEESWRSGGLVEARGLYRLGPAYVGPTLSVWWSPHSRPEPWDDTQHAFWVFAGVTAQKVSPPSGWALGLSAGFSRLHQYYWRDLDGLTVRPFVGRQFRVGRQTVLTPAVGAWFTTLFDADITMPSMLTLSISVGWWGYQTEGPRFHEPGGPEED